MKFFHAAAEDNSGGDRIAPRPLRDGTPIILPPGGGGNLLTETEFRDFVFRFEFRLFAGSNNGLGIRAPLGARDIAYDGIELQIIDNTGERYKSIKPWQKHGSLYHVFPARTGFLRPVGEWNEQEVIARGTRVKIILNGDVIFENSVKRALIVDDDDVWLDLKAGRNNLMLKISQGTGGWGFSFRLPDEVVRSRKNRYRIVE